MGVCHVLWPWPEAVHEARQELDFTGQLWLQEEQLASWLGEYSSGFFFTPLSYCLVLVRARGGVRVLAPRTGFRVRVAWERRASRSGRLAPSVATVSLQNVTRHLEEVVSAQ